MKEEFLVLIFGPIFQIIGTFILILFINKSGDILKIINYSISILIFNLLPIYPLDGGRLLNLFFNKFLAFKKSFILSIITAFLIIISIIVLSIRNNIKLNIILIFIFVLTKIIEEYKKRKYYYNKFLLERYINNYDFKKYKNISNIDDMMRDKKHVFYINNRYITEKQLLQKTYENS